MSSAFGAASPPRTIIGLPVARIRANPVHRSSGEPSSRTRTTSDASMVCAKSVWSGPPFGRDGLASQ
jgi:hypothetical protein